MGTITRNFANNILGTGEVDATDGVNGTIPATNVADASLNNVTSLPSSVGYAIKSVASDPPSLNVGEIFYNSTAGAFKALVNVEAWSSGAPLSVGRQTGGGFGTQTAGVLAGGNYGSPPTLLGVANTEEYNGSGWSPSGNLSTARRYLSGAAGTQTSGIVFGGFDASPGATAATEEYDGSAWTSGGNLVNARGNLGGSGTQTATLGVGGTGRVSFSEEYNGTTWSEGNNLNTGRSLAASSKNGLQTASLVFGGSSAPGPAGTSADTESYDGTSWTTVNSMNQAKNLSTGAGTQTAALSFGGYDGSSTLNDTESWDGTNWSTAPTLGSPNNQQAGTGLQTAALSIGGSSPLTATEEFNSSTNTIVAAAWASGGNLNTARFAQGSATAAVQTAGLTFGGTTGAVNLTATEEYDGASWTSSNNMGTGRYYFGGAGTQTAGLGFGGYVNGSGSSSSTEEYDGTSWTAGGSLGTARFGVPGCGIQTAGLAVGGNVPPVTAVTEEYNGSAWTSGGSLNTARQGAFAFGIQTAAIAAGGATPTTVNVTESYDGSSWTTIPVTTTPTKRFGGSAGTQTSGLIFAGRDEPGTLLTSAEGFDGTSYFTNPSLATGRFQMPGSGTQTAALAIGGANPPSGQLANTEEFTGETITQVAKTLSSS